MAQVPTGGNYIVDNSTGANVRADINEIYDAILTMNSGGSAPSYAKSYTFWADTTAGIMKMRNGANNAFINLFTLAGGIDVDAASNFNEDVTFQCASGTIVFDKSANDLTFSDSVRARFGDSNDLTIFHDGSNSHIEDSGTGGLLIKGDSVNIGASSGEFYFRGFENGAASLRFDNSQKLVTAADRITVDGHVAIENGNLFIKNGFNNANSKIRNTGGSNDANLEFFVRSSGTENEALEITATSNIRIPNDNKTLSFGVGDDLSIFHDPSPARSVIKNVSGNLELITGSGTIRLEGNDGSELMANFSANGGVVLYNDNSDEFHVISTGAKIVSHGTGHGLQVFHSNGNDCAFLGHKGSGDEGMLVLREGGTAKIVMDCEHQRLSLGANSPMQISHDDSTTGKILMADGHNLIIRGADNTPGTPVFQLNPRGNHVGLEVKAHQYVQLRFDNAIKLETTSTGVTVTGTVNETSDIALKCNIQPLTNTLEKIQQITGYKYNLVNSIAPSMGVIAQDVEKVFPELVHGSEGEKTLQYSGLIGVLVEAVKDLSAKVAALEAA